MKCGDDLQLKTIMLTGLGLIFLGLGAIGLLLPVWPTTPFVLASVACFSSAPRIKARIMKISFFKEHIEKLVVVLDEHFCLPFRQR